MRTGGVNCRESAGTGPVNPKVVPVTRAALAGQHGPTDMRLSFSHPTIAIKYRYYCHRRMFDLSLLAPNWEKKRSSDLQYMGSNSCVLLLVHRKNKEVTH